jgi:type IV secretion system protein VirB10
MKLCRLRGLVGLITLALMSSVLPVFAQRGQEVTLNEGTKLTLRLNDHLSTKTARSGDRFSAEVVTPIYKGNTVVIPAGTIVNGRVGNIKRPGRIKGRAEMDLRFESIRLPNGFEEPIVARFANLDRREKGEVDREGTIKGQGSKGKDTAVIATGGGVGAGIGAIAGGAKGTAIGGGAGAIIGLGTVLATRGKDLELQRGTELDIVLDRPLRIAVD